MMSSQIKFSFDSGSFHLQTDVEQYLRQKCIVALDLGGSVYFDSAKIAALVSELVHSNIIAPSSLERGLDIIDEETSHKLATAEQENKRMVDEIARLTSQLNLVISNFQSAKVSLDESAKIISSLRSENIQLRVQVSKPHTATAFQDEASSRPAQKQTSAEMDLLRSQHIEAIASLKVLEEENDQLRKELDELKQSGRQATKLLA